MDLAAYSEYFEMIEFIRAGGALSITVGITLVLMSVVSWTILVLKAIQWRRIQYSTAKFQTRFWRFLDQSRGDGIRDAGCSGAQLSVAKDFQDPSDRIQAALLKAGRNRKKIPNNPYARIAIQALRSSRLDRRLRADSKQFLPHQEAIASALRLGIEQEALHLESGMTVLASIGSLAPFVGLFGTVCGIYHALGGIAASGQTSVDQVAGPVGEALIMTAIGLAVAMPAVLAYNGLLRDNRELLLKFERFALDLHANLCAYPLDTRTDREPIDSESSVESIPAKVLSSC